MNLSDEHKRAEGSKYEYLYDNVDGYTARAMRLSNKLEEQFARTIKDFYEFNALELLGLMHLALQNAYHRVSIQRRLCNHAAGVDIFDVCRDCGTPLENDSDV